MTLSTDDDFIVRSLVDKAAKDPASNLERLIAIHRQALKTNYGARCALVKRLQSVDRAIEMRRLSTELLESEVEKRRNGGEE